MAFNNQTPMQSIDSETYAPLEQECSSDHYEKQLTDESGPAWPIIPRHHQRAPDQDGHERDMDNDTLLENKDEAEDNEKLPRTRYEF